jgi:hypothetical protein
MQLIVIGLIPNSLIYDIWYRIRGIKNPTGLLLVPLLNLSYNLISETLF